MVREYYHQGENCYKLGEAVYEAPCELASEFSENEDTDCLTEKLFGAVRLVCLRLFYALPFEDGEEAGGLVTFFFLRLQGRFLICAEVLGAGAAGMEGAALRGVGGRRYITGE